MSDRPSAPSTPEATAALAQSRDAQPADASFSGSKVRCRGENSRFQIGPRVYRAAHTQPYERRSGEPLYRPLRIFTLDPSASRLEGSVGLVNVPYESLRPGPVGTLFSVDNYDGGQDVRYLRVDLEAPEVLIQSGRAPSLADPRFHQQMVYAVCSIVYAAFKNALGRHIAWGFERQVVEGEPGQLLIRPHANYEKNAYYDKTKGELCFGYYRAEKKVAGRNLPQGFVFTCLSHDIVTHEVTHALLDGLRARFNFASGPDVLAFHEGFADLVAIFQRFSYEEVVKTAIQKSRGNLHEAELLFDLARQFGYTTGSTKPLRTALDVSDSSQKPPQYDETDNDSHRLGSVLVSAVFDAFITIFKRKTERYIRLATNGSGILPAGELSSDLQHVLAEEASGLASQFLNMCIRAIDYCPPVDLEFGEFLRAVITADYDLVPDDPWGYREAWIDAFQRRGIYPRHVSSLSEDALLWRRPHQQVPAVRELSLAELVFEGDPGYPAGKDELRRQACALGKIISQPEHLKTFGLVDSRDTQLGGDLVDLPCVESIRSSRRIGPDGQIAFELIAEVTQRRVVSLGSESFDFYGGTTIIIGPRGEVRYLIYKRVSDQKRLECQRTFMKSKVGRKYWKRQHGRVYPHPQPFQLLHGEGVHAKPVLHKD